MQGSPVAKLSAVPKVNAIDKIDSLPSQLSKKILLSRTKNEEHSFAKLLARAQGKKIEAQVSDAFSSANGLCESKRSFADLRREDVSKTKPVRNDAADTKKESKTDAVKDVVEKQAVESASSDFSGKKSFEYAQDKSRGLASDAEAPENAEVLDAARAALLQDFTYLVDGSRDFETARVGNAEAGGTAESDTDDFFAESVSVSEEAVPFQMGSAIVHTADLSDGETEGGEFSDNGFSDDKAFSFEINDDAVLSKRERTFDADGKILVTDLRTETAENLSEVKP